MHAAMGDLRIGVFSHSVTPPLGCQMAGFDARRGVAIEVHDDLHATAFAFDDGSKVVALISIEVLGINKQFADRVRAEIETRTGIPGANIIISATHTHCGPVTFNHFFNPGQPLDLPYLDKIAEGIVFSAEQAMRNRKSRILQSGFAEVKNVAVNRRSSDGLPIDRDAGVLAVREMDGTIAAIAVNYACHPTVLGPDTLAITADFPFYMAERLRDKFGAKTVVCFFNGAEGDISVGHKSYLSAVGVIAPFRTFEKAQELGERVADAVIAGLTQVADQAPILGVASGLAALPLKTYAPIEEMKRRREQATERLFELEGEAGPCPTPTDVVLQAKQDALYSRIEEYYATQLGTAAGTEPQFLEVELTAIRLGDTAVLSLPGEVFVAIGLEIRRRSSFPITMFFGLANDYIGYISSLGDKGEGYEIVASRVNPSAAEILVNSSLDLLKALRMTR